MSAGGSAAAGAIASVRGVDKGPHCHTRAVVVGSTLGTKEGCVVSGCRQQAGVTAAPLELLALDACQRRPPSLCTRLRRIPRSVAMLVVVVFTQMAVVGGAVTCGARCACSGHCGRHAVMTRAPPPPLPLALALALPGPHRAASARPLAGHAVCALQCSEASHRRTHSHVGSNRCLCCCCCGRGWCVAEPG